MIHLCRHIAITLICAILPVMSVTAPAAAQDTSFSAPDVLDLDDPFARGIKRASELATNGVDLPIPSGTLKPDIKKGAELQGLQGGAVAPAALYRVVGLVVAGAHETGQIYTSSNKPTARGNKPKLPYIRLGSYDSEEGARQTVIDLRVLLDDMLGAHFILRQPDNSQASKGITILDIGPAASIAHAERYCEIIKAHGRGLNKDCYSILEYPEAEPLATFTSTAMLRLAPSAIRTLVSDPTSVFDLVNSSNQILMVREGDMLGAGSYMVTKIVNDGVLLVSEDGNIAFLSLYYLPERRFTEGELAPLLDALPLDAPSLDAAQ